MNCFLLPASLCRALEQVMARFWWRSNGIKRGIHWTTWHSLARTKSCGGLGFRELGKFNVALLAKQCWRLITHPDSFLAKFLKARYYPTSDFLSANLGSNPSYIWRSLWSAKGLIERGIGWRVGSGRNINIWNDAWLPGIGDGRVKRDTIDIRYTYVSDLIHSPTSTWKVDVLEDLFDAPQVSMISSIPLSVSGKADTVVWRLEGSGKYTVKSGYRMLRDDHTTATGMYNQYSPSVIEQFYKEMWATRLPAKVKISFWKIANNFISSYDNLQARRLNVNNVCPFCCTPGETVAHLMRECAFIKQLVLEQGINFISCPTNIAWAEWLANIFCNLNPEKKVVLMVTYWAVWYERNKLIHDGTIASVHDTKAFIRAFIREYEDVNTICPPGIVEREGKWEAPAENLIKFNFDAAFDIHTKASVSAAIGRNHAGLIMASCVTHHNHVFDAFVAEALACLQAVTYAKELGFDKVIIEGDNITVIKRVCSTSMDGSVIGPIIYDIKSIAGQFESIEFRFVQRKINQVAHTLAQKGKGQQGDCYWIEEAPPRTSAAAALDAESITEV
ncbi:hypothetical protein like AT4G29090 [Hibiscus trionum]|uniref:Reverse transcriptase n=1 Tax=Hibiscus trionum TaxID=183268 RepID=A0A9W7HDW3_HIBTR|nr:hypothetical protein like AT4G29090 [Hibiscus trionum]